MHWMNRSLVLFVTIRAVLFITNTSSACLSGCKAFVLQVIFNLDIRRDGLKLLHSGFDPLHSAELISGARTELCSFHAVIKWDPITNLKRLHLNVTFML